MHNLAHAVAQVGKYLKLKMFTDAHEGHTALYRKKLYKQYVQLLYKRTWLKPVFAVRPVILIACGCENNCLKKCALLCEKGGQ